MYSEKGKQIKKGLIDKDLSAKQLAVMVGTTPQYGNTGSVSVADTQALDVLNVDRLQELLGSGVWKQNVTETTKTEYKYKPMLERVLKAVFTGDYLFDCTLDEFLTEQMTERIDMQQLKLLQKKLKGDYAKDREVLLSVLGYEEGKAPDFDVELWHIHRIKNAELIRAVLPEEFLDDTIAEIRKCLIVDSKTAITIDYQKED